MKTALRNAVENAKRVIGSTGERVLPEFVVILVTIMRRYKRRFGVFPNVVRPETFNEKVLCRMLFDRRPILTKLADKYAVRNYVKQRVGEHVLPEWYAVTTNPSTIPFDDLPDEFVVKPTHGSGWVYLVPDKALLNKRELIDTCHLWLNQNYYYVDREWVYQHIQPRIVVEEFIHDGFGPVPRDYRLFVFDGKVALIRVDAGRGDDRRWSHYGRSWDKLDVPCRFKDIEGGVVPPKHLDDMVRCAEILGAGLDFVRVDMYHTQDRMYFGEITTTPVAGMLGAYPDEFNRYLGTLWKLSLR